MTDVDEEHSGINDTATVVVLMEEAGDRWEELTAAMTAVAEEVRSGEEERGEDARGVLFMAGQCTRWSSAGPHVCIFRKSMLRIIINDVRVLNYVFKKLSKGFHSCTYATVVRETGGGVGAQLRKLCGLGRPTATAEMVLLDLEQGGFVNFKNTCPGGGAGVEEVNEASIRQLVADFVAGKLSLESPKPLR